MCGLVFDGWVVGDDFGELEVGVVEDVGDVGGGVDVFEGGVGVVEFFEIGLGVGVVIGVDWENEMVGVVDECVVNVLCIYIDGCEFCIVWEEGDCFMEIGLDFVLEIVDVLVIVCVE